MKALRQLIVLIPFVAATLFLTVLFVAVTNTKANQNPSTLADPVSVPERTCWVRVNDDPTDYDSVQVAVDAANPGDLIKVAGQCTQLNTRPIPPGYLHQPASGVITQVVYITKTIMLQGGYTPDFSQTPDYEANPTVLDAGHQGRVIMIAGHIAPVLEGLYITGGDSEGMGGSEWLQKDVGGGIFVISATVEINYNRIYSNTAAFGGGAFLADSYATINQNIIQDNVAEFPDSIFSDGGGLYLLNGDALVSNNIIESNQAGHNGGGILAINNSPTILANHLVNNYASFGAGVFLWYSDARVDKNLILQNQANKLGGGVFMWYGSPMLTNNVIADNQASMSGCGVYVNISTPRMIHNTITSNFNGDGSGVNVRSGTPSLFSHAYFTNTIIVSQTVGITVALGNTVTVEATLFGDGNWANQQDWGGLGNVVVKSPSFWGDPLFIAPAFGDYHISSDSTAVDQGLETAIQDDIDGEVRKQPYPDIGADEVREIYQQFLPYITISHGLVKQPSSSFFGTLSCQQIE